QQSLRGVLSFCNARQMTAPEAYIHFRPEVFSESGEISDAETTTFLQNFMTEFREHIQRVLTVLPRGAGQQASAEGGTERLGRVRTGAWRGLGFDRQAWRTGRGRASGRRVTGGGC